LCALVGEASAGKSNLLAAIRAVLDPAAGPLTAGDVAEGGDGNISIRIRLADGGEAALEGKPGSVTFTGRDTLPATLFLPAAARDGAVLADGSVHTNGQAAEIFQRALVKQSHTAAEQALSVLEAMESCCSEGLGGLLLLIEEPELYLRPQAQRYLYRLLREFSVADNQVIYSTHSPAFLDVTRLDELVFVERLPRKKTRALQPEPVPADEDFRVMTEFDATRSELFLARAVVFVEGLTEKLVLPFVFAALGYDVDREAISIVECGGNEFASARTDMPDNRHPFRRRPRQRQKGKRQARTGRAGAERADRRNGRCGPCDRARSRLRGGRWARRASGEARARLERIRGTLCRRHACPARSRGRACYVLRPLVRAGAGSNHLVRRVTRRRCRVRAPCFDEGPSNRQVDRRVSASLTRT